MSALERVRDAAGDELVERLLHLDRARRGSPRADREVAPADLAATCDFDVVLAGGGLSLLLAPLLARRGLRVAVFDRGRVGAAHREWNASAGELARLVELGLVSSAELEDLVVARYARGICRWHGGGTYPVEGVLDHAVDAGRLLELARARALEAGVTVVDRASVVAHAEGPRAVRVEVERDGGGRESIVSRVLVDARGASSPFATADLVCPTVGGVLAGLAEGDAPDEVRPDVGEILATTEGIVDGRQHVWEAFPGRAGETTVYLFHYARAGSAGEGTLVDLYDAFFSRLGAYKRGDARLVRPTFGYIPGWSRLSPAPRGPGPRTVLVGDAAARHSPLTFCGFGAMLRSLGPVADGVAGALEEGRAPGDVVPDLSIHAGTGALAASMALLPGAGARPNDLNELLDAAFATLHAMPAPAYAALLRDEMPMAELVSFLRATAERRPRVYLEVMRALGPLGLGRWGLGMARGRLRG